MYSLQSFGHDHMLTFSTLQHLGLFTELDVQVGLSFSYYTTHYHALQQLIFFTGFSLYLRYDGLF